jgi:hypothetical protein
MKRIAEILSWLALAVTLAPACLFFAGRMELGAVQAWMPAGAIVWFLAAPFWMEHKVN